MIKRSWQARDWVVHDRPRPLAVVLGIPVPSAAVALPGNSKFQMKHCGIAAIGFPCWQSLFVPLEVQ
eukprot:4304291-Amphidinium_carterae.1